MEIIQVLKKRYSTKFFEKNQQLTPQQVEQIKLLLQLAPSSTNIQPWHFILATTQAGKQKIAESTQGSYAFNADKILDAAAVVVFCTRITADEAYMQQLLDQEDADGRFPQEEFKLQNDSARHAFSNIHKEELKDEKAWHEKQVYLNLGNFLLGVAALGWDAVPMEGFDTPHLDQNFDLAVKGFASCVIVSIGRHSAEDFNADLPKSRLAQNKIIDEI